MLSAELIRVLKLPLTEVHRRTGMTFETIRKLRAELGIPSPPKPREKWTPEVLAQLGTVPDTVIADELGITPVAVGLMRRRRGISSWRKVSLWLPEEDALLGTDADEKIACRLGRSRQAVSTRRKRLKIPSAGRWTPEEDALLGTAKDADVARRLGRSTSAVRSRRFTLGIPATAFSSRRSG